MKSKEWLAFIGLGLAWGSSFYWIKIALVELGPFVLVAQRLFFSTLALGILTFVRKSKLPEGRDKWRALTLLGFTNVAIPFVLTSWGELHVDSAVASILLSTVPLMTMLIAFFYLREDRLTPRKGIGLLVGFAGVVLLILRDVRVNGESSILGIGAFLGAAAFYATSGIYAKRNTKGIPLEFLALVPNAVADVALWAVIPFVESPIQLPQSGEVWTAIIWLGLLGSGVAYLLYFYLLHAIGPTRTSMVTYTFPIVGIALGVIFLQEKMDGALVLGAILVVGSVLIVNRGD
jgi:drug/metabolite transporter (DMT)-like permease